MKRRLMVILGALVVVGAAGGAWGWRWWRKQHSFGSLGFAPPIVAAVVPARLRLVPVAVGVDRPTDVQFVPGGGTRAIVLEQGGKARLLDFGPALAGGKPADAKTAPIVIDIWVRSLAEMGLLGLAFHPHYPEKPFVYLHYAPWTHETLRSRIAELNLPFATLGQEKAKETRALLELDQEVATHQGGQVAFGPDGKLYVGFGDGSTANDPHGNAQNLGSLHGKLLRLDVDAKDLIPTDNPFVKTEGARPEVWAYGLRNPWRFSFDGPGRVLLGDVGQEAREEVDLVTVGANMGWNKREGSICSQSAPKCGTQGYIDPVFDYDRTVGACVTGGFVVTGDRVPILKDKYVFADFVRGRIWSMPRPATAPAAGTPSETKVELLGEWPRLLSAFGRDAKGDLYVADMATGEILAVMPL